MEDLRKRRWSFQLRFDENPEQDKADPKDRNAFVECKVIAGSHGCAGYFGSRDLPTLSFSLSDAGRTAALCVLAETAVPYLRYSTLDFTSSPSVIGTEVVRNLAGPAKAHSFERILFNPTQCIFVIRREVELARLQPLFSDGLGAFILYPLSQSLRQARCLCNVP